VVDILPPFLLYESPGTSHLIQRRFYVSLRSRNGAWWMPDFMELAREPSLAERRRQYRARWSTASDSWATGGFDSVSPGVRIRAGFCGCGKRAEATDHIWPRARGGDDHPNNLIRMCTRCNSSKRDKSLFASSCPRCGWMKDPGDMNTETQVAFYTCRCGGTWVEVWDLQWMAYGWCLGMFYGR